MTVITIYATYTKHMQQSGLWVKQNVEKSWHCTYAENCVLLAFSLKLSHPHPHRIKSLAMIGVPSFCA